MGKPNLGDKHVCPNCETRYFDLGQLPPTCPKCSTVLETAKGKTKAKAEPVKEETPAVEEVAVEDVDLDVDLDVDDDLETDDENDDLMEDASDLGGDDDIGVIGAGDGKDES